MRKANRLANASAAVARRVCERVKAAADREIARRSVCAECREEFRRSHRRLFCSDRCRRKANGRVGKAQRKARERGAMCEPFDPLRIFQRDRWRCQLCGARTPKRLKGTTDARAPELDHIVPLSRGGAHAPWNVQCACRACNWRKGATTRGQLSLEHAAANLLAEMERATWA